MLRNRRRTLMVRIDAFDAWLGELITNDVLRLSPDWCEDELDWDFHTYEPEGRVFQSSDWDPGEWEF